LGTFAELSKKAIEMEVPDADEFDVSYIQVKLFLLLYSLFTAHFLFQRP
jgi:hypothetical protein